MSSITKPTRFIGLWDTHIGWERANVGGNYVTRPVHNAAAIRAALRFAEDFQPHAVILGGDNFNCGPISHWHHGKPRLVEGFRLKSELELGDEILVSELDRIIPKDGIKKYLYGNHEAWIDDHINSTPALEGMIEPHHYLKMESRGWDIYGYGELCRIGKLYATHGDQVLRRGGGSHPARTLVSVYNRNIRAGHVHQHSVATQVTPLDQKDIHTGVIVPCLCSRSPEYVKNNPTAYTNGFLWGTVWPGGNFTDHVMMIHDNKFMYNNKLYDGNKK